jgi:hypothetical protein
MADTLRFTLKFPFTTGAGDLLTSLPVRRLKRKDISAAQNLTKTEAAMEDMLLAKMFGITLEDLAEFDIADSKSATEVLREMSNGRELSSVLGRSATTGAENAAIGDSEPGDV